MAPGLALAIVALVHNLTCLGTSKPSTNGSHLQIALKLVLGDLGNAQVLADLHLPGNPKARAPSGQLLIILDYNPPTYLSDSSRGTLGGHQSPTKQVLLYTVNSCIGATLLSLQLIFADSWPGGQSLPVSQTAIKAQLQRDSSHRSHRDIPGAPSSGNWEGPATGPYRIPTLQDHSTKSGRHSSST